MNTYMWNYIVLISAFVGLVSCGSSKKTAALNAAPTEKALLWKIEKSDLASPSYLFGTIHIIPADDFFYPKGTLKAIESTDKMVFEIDMKEMTDMGMQMQLMQKSMMKDGKTLKDLLSAEDYQVVSDHFNKMGLPMMMFERMKPAFLTVFASDDMSPTAMQSGEMKSYEMEFMSIGESQNMKTGGLETIDYQLSIFDSLSYELQAEMLVESIKQSDEGKDDLKKMIEIYKMQDLQGLSAMLTDDSVGDMDMLLNNRNRNWIKPMMAYMKEGPTFFAVGAGHLVGEQGVISLLRQQGYKVTPIIEK